MSGTAEQYDRIADFYDVLYSASENDLEETTFLAALSPHLASLPPGARILDASCGHGIQAVALAESGYAVSGTDISPEMIRLSGERAASRNVQLELRAAAWKDLPKLYGKSTFDAVLCWGNSICHTADEAERIETIRIFRSLLKENGLLFIHSRSWEPLLLQKPRYTFMNAVQYGDRLCVPLYIWTWADFEQPNALSVLFQLVDHKRGVEVRESGFTFTPYRRERLVRNIEAAGCEICRVQDTPDGWYFIVCRRAG